MSQNKPKTNRPEKMNSYAQEVLSHVLREFLENDKGLTTITRCETSKDLKHIKVFISSFGNDPSVILAKLNKNIYTIQGHLNNSLSTKIFPKIEFYIDDTPAFADEISRYINDIKKNDEF